MAVSLVLKAANSQVVMRSRRYESKASVQGRVTSLLANSVLDDRSELTTASFGRFYFILNAGDSQVIGTSETYAAEGDRAIGFASVTAN